jgi:hypothetical protein
MVFMKRYFLLLFSFCLVFILPYVGSYIKWGGPPPGFGLFPAQEAMPSPAYNQTYFIFCSCIACIFLIFILFPRLFGFKKVTIAKVKSVPKTNFPRWFVPGVIATLISWFLMWARFENVNHIDHYTFVPLWWGFILVLDSIVYKRTGGKSLIANHMTTMKLLAVVSCFSWFVFEYQNFFVLENWYYPNNKVLTNFGNIAWQLVSYTTVLPAIFEFYFILRTFRSLSERYAHGPKIVVPVTVQYIMLFVGYIFLFLMGLFPDELFWMLWVSLIPALIPAMNIGKYWNPFTEISKKGDYSYIMLIAFATLLNGFFWEFWNFGSEWFHDYAPTNPNYWKYSVPYIDKIHIFSEMPILGYFGYMLFGIVCWVLWLAVAYLIDFDPKIEIDN